MVAGGGCDVVVAGPLHDPEGEVAQGGHGLGAVANADRKESSPIDSRGGEAMFTDGPFVESKEYLAGFWIIEAADLDAALKLAAEASKACNRKVEVRPFLSE